MQTALRKRHLRLYINAGSFKKRCLRFGFKADFYRKDFYLLNFNFATPYLLYVNNNSSLL